MVELGEFENWSPPELVCFELIGTLGAADIAHVRGHYGLFVTAPGVELLSQFNLGPLGAISRV